MFTEEILQSLRDAALVAAGKAALLIADTSPSSLEVERKAGAVSKASEVVSQLDRDAEALILEVLQVSIKKYDLGMLAEESTDQQDRFEKEAFWCIDPLDGTLPFLEGKAGYAVSIALVAQDGAPWIGVVVDPRTGDVLQAVRNQGATLNGEAFTVKSQGDSLTVFTDRSMTAHPLFEDCLEAMGSVRVSEPAGAVMNVCNMLRNAPACYFKFPKPEQGGGSLWDYAATACITREAGGKVRDLWGGTLDLNRKDSTFMNHKGFVYATDPDLYCRVGEIARKAWRKFDAGCTPV